MMRNIQPPGNKERFTQMKTRIRNSRHGLLADLAAVRVFCALPSAQAIITDPDETFPNFTTLQGFRPS